MDLPISASPFISQHYRLSNFHVRMSIPIKPTNKDIKPSKFPSSKCSTNKLIQPIGLYGDSRLSNPLLFGQHNRNFVQVSAKLNFPDKNQPDEAAASNLVAKVLRFGSSVWRFIRPYSMTQPFTASICLFARVMVENKQSFQWPLLFKAFLGLISVVLALVYANGLNQIFDIEIDRMNKPYLPLPAGDLSLKQAWFVTIFSVSTGLLILWLVNADLITTCLYSVCILLAILYSVPPFRVKRNPVATAILLPLTSFCQNIGIFYATKTSLGLPFQWSPPDVFIMTYSTLFFFVVCLIKDIPDVEGDKKYNIQTFAAKFGPKNITFLGTTIMLLTYIGATVIGIYMSQAFKSYIMLPAHSIFALWLLFEARKLERANYVPEASANFYQILWKLLMLELLLFPFI
ncbi:homogentisate solanesyltransferase, chloroplastic-like isoform X2 [Morus notabilis]|uniref:homogentisate solanesyltransferase, chloroplastic-like isoform X2 n=1 Tax=Morus notabilis TaxID=981085 RepID=UPI000CED45DA|nr:homogentisate solanesyltransferase, chloroplastic-like isoform X2 [Morus notabilis]